MFTTFADVRAWIEDNNFAHWVFYNSDPNKREDRAADRVLDSNYYPSDLEDKLAMTEKYLPKGIRLWGVGFPTPEATRGGIVCEARLEDSAQTGVGAAQQPAVTAETIGQLRESITREIRAQIKAEQYEAEKKKFEEEKREFEEEKKSAIGALVHYFAPIGQAMLERKMGARVAGVDAEEPVHAQRIVADKPEEHQEEEQEPFTDEEAEKLMALMVRFKAVEPNYLELIESVVKMAESGDATYTMAKGFLLK